MPEVAKTVQKMLSRPAIAVVPAKAGSQGGTLGRLPCSSQSLPLAKAGGSLWAPAFAGATVFASDRVELPGDVVGDAPEIADIGLANERIGASLVPPVEEVDVLAPRQGGRSV